MSGSNKKIKIDELQHARKVKRSGTSGSKKVAKGGSAVAELAEAIAKLPADARTNGVIECFNKLVKHYDGVILAYVGKRDALSDASEEVEQLQTAIKEQKDDMKALKAKAAALESNRRGCMCKVPKTATSQSGRCGNCSCHKAKLLCTVKCSCGVECEQPDKEKKEAMKLDKEVRARMKKIQKRKGGKAAREESESESGSEDGSDGEDGSGSEGEGDAEARGEGEGASESEEERAKGKKKDKKKSKKRDESDAEEESEEERAKGKKKNKKKRDDSSDEDEARPAAAPSRGRDDQDSADSAAEACDRLRVDDNDEGEMDE